jgi:hypothetical protein
MIAHGQVRHAACFVDLFHNSLACRDGLAQQDVRRFAHGGPEEREERQVAVVPGLAEADGRQQLTEGNDRPHAIGGMNLACRCGQQGQQ